MPEIKPSLLNNTPIASLILVNDDALREQLALKAVQAPPLVKEIIFSARSASYTEGLSKSHDIPEQKVMIVAFIILRIAIGEIYLSRLAATLSSELQIPNDKAQRIAQELEHDLFAPVAVELNQYLAGRKKETQQIENKVTGNPRAAGATNVLDLKQQPNRPTPPPIPRPARPNP